MTPREIFENVMQNFNKSCNFAGGAAAASQRALYLPSDLGDSSSDPPSYLSIRVLVIVDRIFTPWNSLVEGGEG